MFRITSDGPHPLYATVLVRGRMGQNAAIGPAYDQARLCGGEAFCTDIRTVPSPRPTPALDALCRRHTAFSGFLALLTAIAGYRPSIRMGLPFGTRSIKAPRGPRSGRPAMTLQQLLDLDRTPAELQDVTPPPAQAERPSDPFKLILALPDVPAVPMDMLRAMQAAGLLHVAAQAGSVAVLTSHPDH